MSEPCKHKTALVYIFGTLLFEVMPFGLMNAPSTFQPTMDIIFADIPFVRDYNDD